MSPHGIFHAEEYPSELSEKKGAQFDEKRSEDTGNVEILDPKVLPDDASDEEEHVIVTGADAAAHLLSLRDDFDPSLTLRSFIFGTILAAAQATMNQISSFRPVGASISSVLILMVSLVAGKAWAKAFPRGDRLEREWRESGGEGPLPPWIRIAKFINPCGFGLKEHVVAVLMATSASHGTGSISVFTVQILFHNQHLSATTVILSTVSIALFGYGLTGLMQPITVWPSESVYWANISKVHIFQTFHWEKRQSFKIRWFWYILVGVALYEIIPTYIFPYLNSVSIPCLAAMNVKDPHRASIITNLFGGSISNEGLGILSLSFDWANINALEMPLKWVVNSGIGTLLCIFVTVGVYYGNAWGAKSQPFMSSSLHHEDGSPYSVKKVFDNGILNVEKLKAYGLPRMAGTYAWMQLGNNMAIGGAIAHVSLFWGRDLFKIVKDLRKGHCEDPHHAHMMKHYKPVRWYVFAATMLFSFILGLVVVLKENITLPVWAYIVALLFGTVIAPFSSMLYARFNSGVNSQNLMKMFAGVLLPGRPIGNLYFSAWSYQVISQSVNLASDFKMGEYLKIDPAVMFFTQVWGTVFGAFINYVVMITIVNTHRDILVNGNGSYLWTGVGFQSLNNKATTWALAKYLYVAGTPYVLIPCGLGIGFGLVALHRVFSKYVPKIGRFNTSDLNLPTILVYLETLDLGANSSVMSGYITGFIGQFFIRNYRPRWYKNYLWLWSGASDAGASLTLMMLSLAVYGAAGNPHPFPRWWGNHIGDGEYVDHCPNPNDLQ